MPRRASHRYYEVEPGVYATLRGFGASTGLRGCLMVHLDFESGVDHLFTLDRLPATLRSYRGPTTADKFARGVSIARIADLPVEIRERYRLDGYDFVALQFFEPDHWKNGTPKTTRW